MTRLATMLGLPVIAICSCLATAPAGAHQVGAARPVVAGGASWYGAELHGRLTASGERFDMNDLTAAHPSLPFGTAVRVTNQANGRSVVVRINDRGPASGKRVIDLSRRAAEIIGILRSGVGRVTIEVLERA